MIMARGRLSPISHLVRAKCLKITQPLQDQCTSRKQKDWVNGYIDKKMGGLELTNI